MVALADVGGDDQAQQQLTLAGRDVVVWSPPSRSGRQPVLIFSRVRRVRATSKFLTEALAAHGYWVFAPTTRARCNGGKSGGGRPEEPFGSPQSWTDQSFVDRRDDIRAIQQALATSPEFRAGSISTGSATSATR
jgi:hypothetical protein